MDWYRLLPRFWYQNYPTSRSWDKVLNVLLDTYGVTEVGSHVCKVGPVEVWVGNWPYAYGRRWPGGIKDLPLVKTRIRLKAAIEAKFIEDLTGKLK